MEQKEIDALVAKVTEAAGAKVGEMVNDALKGFASKEELTKALEGLNVKAEDIKIDGKSLVEILKLQGEALANATNAAIKQRAKNIADLMDEKKSEIEKVFREKSGFVTIEVKDPVVMTTGNTADFDTNAVPAEIMDSMSLGAVAFKRYGKQFIAAIADRQVVTNMDKQYTVWDEEGDIEGAFAIVSEGALKPLLSAELVKNFAEAQKVAGKYVITEELEKFYPRRLQIIERIIRDKMIRDYEALLRTGLAGVAASYTGTALDGTITDPNNFDAIGAVIAQEENLNFVPDTIILNPVDKWAMRLTKDTMGRYIMPITVSMEDGTTRVWELQVVTSTYQTQGTFTVAESGLYKIEEEVMSVRLGYGITMNGSTPESDFDYNRRRIIVETWFKQYLPTPYVGSVVTGNFNTIKTALEADVV